MKKGILKGRCLPDSVPHAPLETPNFGSTAQKPEPHEVAGSVSLEPIGKQLELTLFESFVMDQCDLSADGRTT